MVYGVAQSFRLAPCLLLAALSLFSAQSHALSCRAGTTDGQVLCSGTQFSANVSTSQDRGNHVRFGQAYVDARTGAMGGQITLADSSAPGGPSLGDGQFAAAFDDTIRINGPASAGPVIVSFLFSVTGGVSGACILCSGDISFMYRLDGASFSGLQLKVAASRSKAQPDWTFNNELTGLNSSFAFFDPVNAMGSVSFDISSQIGQQIRIRGDLGGSVALIGGPEGAFITANAMNTALFNVLVPSGYTFTSTTNTNFLAAPVLLAVPAPPAAWMLGSGLLCLAGLHRRLHTRNGQRRSLAHSPRAG